MAPFGRETGDTNHNRYFVFKVSTTVGRTPPVVKLKTTMLHKFKERVRTEQKSWKHYALDVATAIIPINDLEGGRNITRMVMIPLKWAGELVAKNAIPHDFYYLFKRKLKIGLLWMGNIRIIWWIGQWWHAWRQIRRLVKIRPSYPPLCSILIQAMMR